MDGFGKNRFELLCLDEDAGDAPLGQAKQKKVKQTPPAGNVIANSQPLKNQNAKVNNQLTTGNDIKSGLKNTKKNVTTAEKENKSAVLNKNVDKNKKPIGQRDTQTSSGPGQQSNNEGRQFSNNKTGGNQQRNPNFKQLNGETREQRNNRRNQDDNYKPFNNRNDRNQNNDLSGQTGQVQNNNDGIDQRPRRDNRNDRRDNDNRGPRQNRNFEPRTGKREFDRQSGSDKTGVKAIDKKDGAGGYNWGSPKQDIEDLNKSADENLTDKDETANESQKEDQTVPVEEETKEFTLDEWKAQRQQRAKPQYNIRKAGEGEDLSQWKKMVALDNKAKRKGESDEEELEYDPSMYPQRVGRLQRIVDIDFHFTDGGRRGGPGRGRGGRGQRNPMGGPGGRGGGGGGDRGDRGDRDDRAGNADGERRGGPAGAQRRVPREKRDNDRQKGQHAPKVDDERQFPTLSLK